eukprot:2157775-Pleurochrysis_carterae.AAC.1
MLWRRRVFAAAPRATYPHGSFSYSWLLQAIHGTAKVALRGKKQALLTPGTKRQRIGLAARESRRLSQKQAVGADNLRLASAKRQRQS